jgi:transcriptional regulator with XRE-family HTH domain
MKTVNVDSQHQPLDGTGSAESAKRLGDRVRMLREARTLSLRTLASRAGFSPSFISQVENGQASPSIASLERIAGALGVTLAQFFRHSEADEPIVVRASQRPDLVSAWSRAEIELLGPSRTGGLLEPMMLTLEPGGRSGSQPYAHAGEEFAIVFEGEVSLTLGEAVHQLARGDAVTFPAAMPHQWVNHGAEPARIVVVSARRPG